MAEPMTREAREKAWWDAWWAEDFSWAGLAKKPVGQNGQTIHGGLHGEKTLQDYWRRDPASGAVRDDAALESSGELVRAPDGAMWHLAHVPLAWADGTAAKSGWDETQQARLAAVIGARLAAGAETTVDLFFHSEAADGRAQLAGAVLTAAPTLHDGESNHLHIVADRVWHPQWNAGSVEFGPGASFSSALFSGENSFVSATFNGNANYYSATFLGNANFYGATFTGDAHFDSATFLGPAFFSSATFLGEASFDSAIFSTFSVFEGATFSGYARFVGATFWAYARFDDAVFSKDASFSSATFSGEATFVSATFSEDAGFSSTTFSDDARFASAIFSGKVSFDLSAWAGRVSFQYARFQRDVTFLGEGALLKDPDRLARVRLSAGERVGEITQAGVVNARARRAFLRADFDRAIFEGDADFSNRDFLEPSSFRDATFHGLALFHGAALHQGQSFHGAAFEEIVGSPWPTERVARRLYCVAATFAELSRLNKRRPASSPPYHKWRASAKADWLARAGQQSWERGKDHWLFARTPEDERYERIEAAFRSLKLAMEGVRNRVEEQRYYRLELLARQKRRDIPLWERLASRAYGRISDFGNSLERPFWTLLLTALAFAALYTLWGALLRIDADVLDALTFSAGRVAPFGPWAAEPAWLKALDAKGSGWGFAARLVATVESLFAIVLAFLFALAVRRRFQIT